MLLTENLLRFMRETVFFPSRHQVQLRVTLFRTDYFPTLSCGVRGQRIRQFDILWRVDIGVGVVLDRVCLTAEIDTKKNIMSWISSLACINECPNRN